MAMALDCVRTGWVRCLSVSKLQDCRQPFRVPADAKTALLSVWRMAVGRNDRCLAQPTPGAYQCDYGWHGGILIRMPGVSLHDHKLVQAEANLRCLDNRKLVARNLGHIPGQRASLRADAIPDFYPGRFCWAKSILVRNDLDGVASFSRSLRRTLRPRLVGILM